MEEKIFEFLSRHIILTEEEKNALLGLDLLKDFKKGHVLLREGEYARESYFVIEGCLRTYHIEDGEEKTTAFYIEEESISPESLVNREPSKYFISCEQNSIVLVATPDMEKDVFEKFPKFETLCRVLSEKELAKNQASFANYISSTPEERYEHLIETKPTLLNKVPQYQIASYLGIKPESLSRIRKRRILRES